MSVMSMKPVGKTTEQLRPDVAQWIVQALTRLSGTYALLNGLAITAGGRQRWSGRALATAMSVPGAPATWGVTLMIFGALALGGTFLHIRRGYRVVAMGMWGIAAWSLFFALSLAITAVKDPQASTTGIATYGALAVYASTLTVAYLQSRTCPSQT